jgi:hypothetical protein
VRWKIEVALTTLGWVEIEAEPEEPPGDIRERAKGMVEECELVPVWTEDVTVRTMRMYDADAACEQKVGSTTPYCSIHDQPFEKGLDVCSRRLEDVALRIDPDQERLW